VITSAQARPAPGPPHGGVSSLTGLNDLVFPPVMTRPRSFATVAQHSWRWASVSVTVTAGWASPMGQDTPRERGIERK